MKIIFIYLLIFMTAGLAFFFLLLPEVQAQQYFNSTNKYAWSENAGWLNFKPNQSQVIIYDDHLEGHVWAENIGWISMGSYSAGGAHTYLNDAADTFGVNHDGNGHLSGYAWSENVGGGHAG